jgi:hypothetical protein
MKRNEVLKMAVSTNLHLKQQKEKTQGCVAGIATLRELAAFSIEIFLTLCTYMLASYKLWLM